jgi:gamma-glutamylcyclotransferase (GGCT)/AIG2-like uncharacterized protein YtfP
VTPPGRRLLFVYGSLMRGEANAAQMESARWAGAATTAPSFTLVDLGRYPALVDGGVARVRGEVYEVGDVQLDALDRFEGIEGPWHRSRIRLDDGREAEAYLVDVEHAGVAPATAADHPGAGGPGDRGGPATPAGPPAVPPRATCATVVPKPFE